MTKPEFDRLKAFLKLHRDYVKSWHYYITLYEGYHDHKLRSYERGSEKLLVLGNKIDGVPFKKVQKLNLWMEVWKKDRDTEVYYF